MKILVTGGTGFIGSHTVVELQKNGHEVWIADNLSNSERSVLKGMAGITGKEPRFAEIDLCTMDKLDRFFESSGPFDGVIHFAAFKAVGESMQNPLKYYRNNLGGMANLLVCMQKYHCRNLVFSSSCTVYGQPETLPVREEEPIKPPLSPYGNTKQICEEMIMDASETGHVKAEILRYFNPAGAHDSALIGELPIGTPNNLVPYITQTAIGKRDCLNVFGDDYDTPDGTCIRDYIHIVDLAKAHIIAMNRMACNLAVPANEVFNLGTGNGYSVMDVIRSFEKVSGKKLPYKMAPRRKGDIEKVWADTGKANQVLGWKAERNLDDMLSSAWKWELTMKEKKHI